MAQCKYAHSDVVCRRSIRNRHSQIHLLTHFQGNWIFSKDSEKLFTSALDKRYVWWRNDDHMKLCLKVTRPDRRASTNAISMWETKTGETAIDRALSPLERREWSISNFPCSLTRNITSHSMENLAFPSLLRWKMIIRPILTTSLIHFFLKGWENVLGTG